MKLEHVLFGIALMYLLMYLAVSIVLTISQRRSIKKITSLTMDDFMIKKKETVKRINTRDFLNTNLVEVRKDKSGEIYYFVKGILYTYGSTPGISLAITDSDSREQLYRITKKQYEDFMCYIENVDCIEVPRKEIHFSLPEAVEKKIKLPTKNNDFYASILQVPHLNEKAEFSDEELEKILSAIKENLKGKILCQ